MARGYDIDDLFGEATEGGLIGDGLMFPPEYSPLNGPFDSAPFHSPAMQQTKSTSSFNSDLLTVSPQEIMNDDLISAPNSAAFTAMTSPSWESPCLSTDTSPVFGNESDLQGSNHWYPLFGSVESSSAATAAPVSTHRRQLSTGTISGSPMTPDLNDEQQLPPQQASRTTSASSSAGVGKRRGKPLKPIKLEESSDTTDFKRRRNTLAARKSRAKKAETMDAQKDEIERSKEMIATLEDERDKEAEEKEFWKQKYFDELHGRAPSRG